MILKEITCNLNVIGSPCSKFNATLSEIQVKSKEY